MDTIVPKEEILNLREFKKETFQLYWDRFGTFFLHAMPHPNLSIGNRGLLEDEKESGIVLVFGPRATRDIEYGEEYLYADLQFGYKWESVAIPWDCVFRLYDKAQQSVSQMKIFILQLDPEKKEATESIKDKQKSAQKDPNSNVIQVNFGGKPKS